MTDKTPVQLLEEQTQALASILQLQLAQKELLERIETSLAYQNQRAGKILDVNMPFSSLVGFIMKFVLASIPASIMLGLLSIAILAGLGGCSAILSGIH
jgi:hypothetical protein